MDMDKKTKNKKYYIIIAVLTLCVVVLGGLLIASSFSKNTKELIFDENNVSLTVGESYYVHVTVIPEDARDRNYNLVSSDESIASVADGVVTGVSQGTAIIKAVQNDVEFGQCIVTVRHIEPQRIEFQNAFEGKIGRSDSLKIVFSPSDVTDTEMEYSVTDSNIAHISGETLVYDAEGFVTVTAVHKSTGLRTSTDIQVTPIELEAIHIKDPGEVFIGTTVHLQVELVPGDATESEYTWRNFDNQYASLTDGVLVPKKEGKITVQVTHDYTEQTASLEIDIKRIHLNSLIINLSEGSRFNIGDEFTLAATPEPSNTSETNIRWTSSNSRVAAIEENKLIAKNEGSATITATDRISGISASATIDVSPVLATSISLFRDSLKLSAGETITLGATIRPDNVTDPSITWSSSDSSVATVNSKGLITAKKAGTARITAKTTNNKTATCLVTVTPAPVTITNGYVLRPSRECVAPVTIHAPAGESVYVYFKCSSDSRCDFSMLVKAGTTCEVDAPIGTYKMYYASGDVWYGKEYKFGENTQYYTSPDIFTFYFSGDYVYGTELTLYKVANGNMTTTEISDSQFPG